MTVSTDGSGTSSGRTAAASLRDARVAWIAGGSLLIVHSALILVANGMPGPLPVNGFVLSAIWGGALLVFAFGWRRSGSVVARRPLGVAALAVSAAMPLVSRLAWIVVPDPLADPTIGIMIGQALAVIELAALVTATVVIARGGAVPHRMRWVPLIVLAVTAGAQVALQAVAVAAPDALAYPATVTIFMGAAMLGTLGTLAIGILALVFAPREQPRADEVVQVYPPAQ